MIKIMAEPRVLTQRNKEKYTYNGCMFQFDRLSSDCSKKFWRCDRRGEGCKARIHTDIATNQVSIFSVYGMLIDILNFECRCCNVVKACILDKKFF